jgi:hypothetical protein
MDSKSRWQSKTFWFHIMSAAVAMSTVGLAFVGKLELTPQEAMILTMGFTGVQTVGGLWLREITRKAIK